MHFRSRNPVLNRTHDKYDTYDATDVATYSGVIVKSAVLLGLMLIFGSISMFSLMTNQTLPGGGIAVLIVAPIVGFISVIVAMFKPHRANIFAPIYAIAQGTFLGAISGIYEIVYGGNIVATAMFATFAVFAALLVLYSTGLITVTETFRRIMYVALLGLVATSFFIFIFLITGILSYEQNLGLIFGIVVLSVVVASLFLILDFNNIEQAVENRVSKQYEWVLSLGLLVTLVWLYIELLRLIAILRRD